MTILAALKERAAACLLCDLIHDDLVKNGKLTDWSRLDGEFANSKTFPKGGKINHIKLERFSIDNIGKPRILNVE